MTEREGITPNAVVDLTVELKTGEYEVACKPGETGDGIRQKISVTGATATKAAADPRLRTAVAGYRAYIQEQADEGLPLVEKFAAAVIAGDLATARATYAPSRQGWERVEPVAESFGDLDPKLDLREADLEPGQEWTGWHRLEKAIFFTKSTAGQAKYATQLIADYKSFQQKVRTAELTPTSMANGAKELLDEVASGKITGEENIWSGADLWDFSANVAGARKVYDLLSPVVASKNPELKNKIGSAFTELTAALAPYQRGLGYLDYRQVKPTERKQLADLVNSLAEPLSELAAATV